MYIRPNTHSIVLAAIWGKKLAERTIFATVDFDITRTNHFSFAVRSNHMGYTHAIDNTMQDISNAPFNPSNFPALVISS